MDVFTSGTWVVKPGLEDDFIAAWQAFAEWTKANAPGAGWVYLTRDTEQANRFVSFGPWQDAGAIAAWRAMPGFQERIRGIRELLEHFEAMTLEQVLKFD